MLINVGKAYRHKNGRLYKVLNLAIKIQDPDGNWVKAVEYAALEPNGDYGVDGYTYVRSQKEFCDRFKLQKTDV